MSANINVTAKGYSFAALEDVAVWWSPDKKHNLMTAESTPAEWMERSGQGYDVKSAPLYMRTPDGELHEVPNRRALYHGVTNAHFGIVSPEYKIHQNSQYNETAERLLESLNSVMDREVPGVEGLFEQPTQFERATQGVLGQGERVWIGLRAKSHVTIANQAHAMNISLVGDHTGKGASRTLAGTTCIVCENTFNGALGSAAGIFALNHRKEYSQDEMIAGFAAIIQNVAEYKQVAESLLQAEMKEAQIVAYFKSIAKIKPEEKAEDVSTRRMNQYRALWDAYNISVQREGRPANSAWSVWNAVTRYVDHSEKRDSNPARRFDSANFGPGAAMKIDALANLRQLVAA